LYELGNSGKFQPNSLNLSPPISPETLIQLKKDLDILVKSKEYKVAEEPPKPSIRQRLRPTLKKEKQFRKSLSSDDKVKASISTSNSSINKENTAKDLNGFSHLEWSSSVPYNLAEEPDEVKVY
jgi:hypothetical protein